MQRHIIFSVITVLLAVPLQAQFPTRPPLPPIRIILVGDSTMAPRNGWGPGFSKDVVPEVTFINMARNGRSSGSYRAEGSWTRVMDVLKSNTTFDATYVLIQFGHNDQPGKPGRSTNLTNEFPANIRQYVEDVRSTGAKPILVTPLTRRWFTDGKLKNDLIPWADAIKKVAAETGVPVIDLNTDSAAAVQKMGPVEANTLAMAPPPPIVAESAASGTSVAAPKPTAPTNTTSTTTNSVAGNNAVEHTGETPPVFDYTHLGPKGSAFFAHIVVEELSKAVPDLQPYLKP